MNAFEEATVFAATLASLMDAAGRRLVGIKKPVNMIFRESVLVNGAGVIEHDRIGLAVTCAQGPADHLAVKPHLFCRARQNAATDVGAIKALRQNHAVGNELGFAGLKASEDGVAIIERCSAIEMFGSEPAPNKLRANVHGVCDVDGKDDGLPSLAELGVMLAQVPDQLRGVHAVGELPLVIIALDGPHALKVGINRGIDGCLDEYAAHDQFCDLRSLDDLRKRSSQPPPIAAAWRGRASDNAGLGI